MSRISKLMLAGFLMLGPLAGCSNQANTENTTETAKETDSDNSTDTSKETADAADEIGTASDKTTAYTIKNETGSAITELSLNGEKNLLNKDLEADKSVVWNLEKPKEASTLKIKADGKEYEVKDVKFDEIDDKNDVSLVKDNGSLALKYKNIGGKDITLAFKEPESATQGNSSETKETAPAETSVPAEQSETSSTETYSEPDQTYTEPATDTTQNYSEPAYQEPAYQEPAYEQPAYSEPAYQEPAYTEPAVQEPSYTVPEQSQDGCLGEDALIPQQSQDGCLGESALIG